MTTAPSALATIPAASTSITEMRMSVQQLVAQRSAIVEAMKGAMVKDIDYGVIPGTPKPTLYKPGSEKILSMFHLAVTPTVEDLSTPDCIRYRVHVTVTHAPTGNVLGTGIGEASSAESKYQWRRMICAEEWEATPEDRRRVKWAKGDRGPYSIQQIRAEMDDVANTVLKMAKKRAQIDAVLTVTAASDIFSQDIEDLKAAGLDISPDDAGVSDPTTAAQQQTQQKQELERKPEAQHTQPQTGSAACISPDQAKRFWAAAIRRTNDYKAIMNYLRDVHGVGKKEQIMAGRYEEAMAWAERG